MVELDRIKDILKNRKIKFKNKKNSLFFKISKRKIKIEIDNDKIYTTILNYDGLHPICHISNSKNNKGRLCLDNNANRYYVNSYEDRYIDRIKDIINEKNHSQDSFNDLEVNIYVKGFFNYCKLEGEDYIYYPPPPFFPKIKINFKNIDIIRIEWDDFRFRKYEELVECLDHKKINWDNDILIIFYLHSQEKLIFVTKNSKKMFLIPNYPQTIMCKTGAQMKNDTLIIIVGLGSLGSEIFERFRLAGHTNFVIIDPDQLNYNNDYRWAYPVNTLVFLPKKVKLIKSLFEYLNIQIFPKNINEIKSTDIQTSFLRNKNQLIFIDATAEKKVEKQSLKLWHKVSQENDFSKSTYKLSFLEQNGLSLHTFSINFSQKMKAYDFYESELEKFSQNQENKMILEKKDKYIHQRGCIGETEIYSQNSVKSLTIKARHLLQENNEEDYNKINILIRLVWKKGLEEWDKYLIEGIENNEISDLEEIDYE